ncbi:MAG: hypothetical protein IPP69_08860 [Flavobacteriales bacterium]|nr:hypothetical protein [Flavobacteriales bacterium]
MKRWKKANKFSEEWKIRAKEDEENFSFDPSKEQNKHSDIVHPITVQFGFDSSYAFGV